MEYKISIIVRTYNESKHIEELMKKLKGQTYKNFETIVIDSESTDDTISIVNKYAKDVNLKIIPIKKSEFDYSYSSNIGVKNSTGDIICFLSGHSVPVYDNYLEETNNVFQEERIAGCYGEVIAHKDGSIYEKIYNKLGILKNNRKANKEEIVLENKFHKGMLSCSNASIRKEILLKHPFAEELGKNGGEDLEVAYRILQDGFLIAKASKLLVRHSHGKNLIGFMKELINWKKIYKEVLEYIESRG